MEMEASKNGSNLPPNPEPSLRLGYTSLMRIGDNGLVVIGITSRYLATIEEIDQIELLAVNARLSQGSFCARLNGPGSFTYALPSPISGKIFERNEKLVGNPQLLGSPTSEDGWLYKLIPEQLDYEKQFLIPCQDEM